MFLFSFALILLIIVGVSSDQNTLPSNSVEKALLFGQFQNLLDTQNPPSISCYRVRANIKNAHPTDNTKYVICRDEKRYEIFTCPNGGIFNNNEKACIDLCEQKKPCLNQGQCIILANLTLQCVCRRDWTGERCEIPLSTCAQNPCGPKAECRMLKANDYSQDYVCICNNQQSYGRNCQQTVPNPCLMNIQQFHPFAYSRQAYINCDDELIFFQPCNGKLYWNQEDKRCDRFLPALLRTPFKTLNNRWQNTQQQNFPTLSQGLNAVDNTQRFPATETSKVTSLTGFSNQKSNQQNNQIQSTGNFNIQSLAQPQSTNNQPWLQNQNQQLLTKDITSQLQTNQQQSWQTFSGQSQPNQLTASSFETTTVANKGLQQGLFSQGFNGWKSNQQGLFKQK